MRRRGWVVLAGVLCIISGAIFAVHGQRTILLMVTHTDRDEEYAHVREILENQIPGVVLTELGSDEPTAVAQALQAADAFLIPEQEEAADNQMFQLGEAWASALRAYVNRGGLIIELVGFSANRGVELMRGAGLTSASDVEGFIDVALRVVDRSHYLSAGVPDTFNGMNGTIAFGRYDGDVVVATEDGRPVVFEKHVGSGSLVAIGFDYFEYNDAMAQVLVNAVGAATEDVYVEKREEVVLDVIRDILADAVEGAELYVSTRPLASGSTVETWTGDVRTTSAEEWMVFVDDVPEANWGHPARYVFQDAITGIKTVIQAILPPLDFQLLMTVEVRIDAATGRIGVEFAPPGEGLAIPEGEDVVLLCDGTHKDSNIEFPNSTEVYAYHIRTQPGGTLNVSVADRGMPGDFWQADIYEGGAKVATTRGGGEIDAYSHPASVRLTSGEATVVVQYGGGIDVWPANMSVRMWCGEATASVPGTVAVGTDVDIVCSEEYIEEELEFEGPLDAWTYDLTLYPGATLDVWVGDSGTPGDIWLAEIYTEDGLADWTYGDGSTDSYSYPAEAFLPSGLATVSISYDSGVDIWPAHMWVRMECTGGTPAIVEPIGPVEPVGSVTPVGPVEPVTPVQPADGKKVAVLISGGGNKGSNYDRYWNDLSFMYRTLKEQYGYSDENIHVVYADGSDTSHDQKITASGQYADSPQDLDGNGSPDIDRAATRQDLAALFDDLRGELTERDQLFVFTTNHGSQDPEETDHAVLVLYYNEHVTDADFAQMVSGLNVRTGIFFFEQCFSGGMIAELEQRNHIVMSAADWDEYSWGCDTEGAYNELAYHFVSALRGRTPTGESVNADANGDGIVSIREAFDYAKRMDSQSEEHPQYFEGTSGAGENATL